MSKGLKPYILDTSVVIDGRVADLVETDILDNTLIMPRFVLSELQRIADSSDKLRRSRGRRGLDILNRLRGNKKIDLKIYDRDLAELSGHPVDMKLVLLAKHLEGKIVTGRLQPQQDRSAPQRAGHQSERRRQRAEAGLSPGRGVQRPDHEAGRSGRPGGRLPGRRHDDRRGRRPGTHWRNGADLRDQRAADQCRSDDLRAIRRDGDRRTRPARNRPDRYESSAGSIGRRRIKS